MRGLKDSACVSMMGGWGPAAAAEADGWGGGSKLLQERRTVGCTTLLHKAIFLIFTTVNPSQLQHPTLTALSVASTTSAWLGKVYCGSQ